MRPDGGDHHAVVLHSEAWKSWWPCRLTSTATGAPSRRAAATSAEPTSQASSLVKPVNCSSSSSAARSAREGKESAMSPSYRLTREAVPMRWTKWVDRFQRRHPAAGFPIAVIYKYMDDDGHFLGALVTYYGFLSLFPTLLLLATVLGLVLAGNPELQQQLLDSALAEFPVIGPQLARPEGLGGGVTGIVVGGLVALYGALGMGQALQHAMNTVWAVPRHSRPDPFTSRGRSLLLLCTLGLLLLTSTVISAVGTGAAAYGGGFTGGGC